MFLLTPSTTEQYLRDRGELDANETVRVSELAGGVSNQVLLVERSRGDRFVLKQAREQLRVEQEWKCDVRRILREMDVLRLCGEVLREANILWQTGFAAVAPDIVWEDRPNYTYAMTAAPKGNVTWKSHLLDEYVHPLFGTLVGSMLGHLHARTWKCPKVESLIGDQTYFTALRLDPYFRRTSEVHPRLKSVLDEVISFSAAFRLSLVHGDFSPKNVLLSGNQVLLIDFEVGHFGDPAFDVGFCLSHLMLKGLKVGSGANEFQSLAMSFWEAYSLVLRRTAGDTDWKDLGRRSALFMAACMLARVDGKSQVDYLNAKKRETAREFADRVFHCRPATLEQAIAYLVDFTRS